MMENDNVPLVLLVVRARGRIVAVVGCLFTLPLKDA